MNPRVCVIVLNWNGWEDTIECLESLFVQDHAELRVVVCDNGSTNDSVEQIRKWAARAIPDEWSEIEETEARASGAARDLDSALVLIRLDTNLGFVGGNNVALEYIRQRGDVEHVLMLNNDAVLEPHAVSALVAQAQRSGAGAVMPLIYRYASDEIWYAGGAFLRPWGRVQHWTGVKSDEPYRSEIFTACCVLIPLPVLDAVGAFDERYFLYLEDTDLALRIRDAGFGIWVEPKSIAYHKVSRSSGGDHSPNVLYYLIRNNLLLISQRSRGVLERWLGYGYVGALTLKIALNLSTRRLPEPRAVARGLVHAWRDFGLGRWGRRP